MTKHNVYCTYHNDAQSNHNKHMQAHNENGPLRRGTFRHRENGNPRRWAPRRSLRRLGQPAQMFTLSCEKTPQGNKDMFKTWSPTQVPKKYLFLPGTLTRARTRTRSPTLLIKHTEGAAPASTDKRLAIELATVKAKAVSCETDLRWIDAKYHIADCLTKHASRKSEAVLQKILQEAHSGELRQKRDLLDRRKREREIRNSPSCDEESWPTSEQADGEMSCRQEEI